MGLGVPEFIAVLQDSGIRPDVILDAGAFDGADTALMSRAFPAARAIAIEGDPGTYVNCRPEPPVEYHCAVLSDVCGPVQWWRKSGPKLNGMFNHAACGAVEIIAATSTRLDVLLPQLHVAHVDVMKLDVEGAAYEVLTGMGKFLERVAFLHVETETRNWFPGMRYYHRDVVRLLQAAGMQEVASFEDGGQVDSIWRARHYYERLGIVG